MFSKATLAQLALAGIVPSALAAPASGNGTDSGFNWGPCEFEGLIETEVEYECSNFTVPLDYLDDSGDKTTTLQVTRVPAVNGESKGSLFFNFGGPGLEVRNTLIGEAEKLQTITEGKWDLVGWDPRGTANTMTYKCYNDTERPIIMGQHRLEDVGGPEDKHILARNWASTENLVNDCVNSEETADEYGELIGTGYVARDLMQLVDALDGEDALLNFWGISYGTILGATVAALFPERMGQVVLDGNVNLHEYYNGIDYHFWDDSDDSIYDYFERCVEAGPELCPIAADEASADDLNDKFYSLLDELRTAPVALGGTTVLDYSALVSVGRLSLYSPSGWVNLLGVLTELFKDAEDRDIETLAEAWAQLPSDLNALTSDESAIGIYCSDKVYRNDDFEDVFAAAEGFADRSKALGNLGNGMLYFCARWPWHAKGAYEGSLQDTIETKNPLLFVGNTLDPVTPLGNCHNSSAIFDGSGVLEHGGIGHGSTPHMSLCTAKALREFFNEGNMPEEDLACEDDYNPFDTSKSWEDALLPELGWE